MLNKLPLNPTLFDILRLKDSINLQYCFIRYKGLFRPTSQKFFYTDTTLVMNFIKAANTIGVVNSIEFPTDKQLEGFELTDTELTSAWSDGRVVV